MVRNRVELAKHFNKLGFKHGAEIGVADGRYSEILCKNIPGLVLNCIDPWARYDGNWRSDEYQDKAFKQASERLRPYDVIMFKMTGMKAVKQMLDDSLDFVFIDGAHDFNNVMLDIILWSKKVKKGGIIAGHDYYHFNNSGVIEAVNAYTEAHKIDLQLTLKDSAEHKDDQCPCWWWVKK
jgi:hypothetical protein